MSVGALITWPYKAGGRSRRGSHKAGTTVGPIMSSCRKSYMEIVVKIGVLILRKLHHSYKCTLS